LSLNGCLNTASPLSKMPFNVPPWSSNFQNFEQGWAWTHSSAICFEKLKCITSKATQAAWRDLLVPLGPSITGVVAEGRRSRG
jgi:hypothetical protein